MEITKDLLKQWSACTDGYSWFLRNFPQGGPCHVVAKALRGDKRYADEQWLYSNVFNTFVAQPETIAAVVQKDVETQVQDGAAVIQELEKEAASGYGSQLAASGYGSQLAASGDGSRLAASGDGSQLAASGDGSQLAASGYDSRLAASGYDSRLAASGDGSQLAASGDGSQLAASGDG
ncbi:MAG: hypothetical protein PHI64_12790, partial [Zoogloea sp.]|uniref:hypothetical protein n=1 Tax=Zoogloea sp. TaxID=49181 RepID=UPI0026139F64